ncbi:hypothetical protein [Butyrivibrio sp. MC2013]|uniref:hypothetical protein n=1 Tax=Butyrivibrio sp. MC2013 TaxID=1280686 RepID=UPI00047CF2CA|nr:hypothetical protein [Butyrivibrio sp. MC2013]
MKMRRLFLGASILLVMGMCAACSQQADTVQHTAQAADVQTDSTIETVRDIILPDTSSWTKQLANEGETLQDLDFNEQEDKIVLSYKDVEGSQRIQDFYVLLNGNTTVSISDDDRLSQEELEDRSLEDILAFDFDRDSNPEYVFLFDTHGAGGNGTHDAWVLWVSDMPRFELFDLLDYYEEGEGTDSEGGLDTLYQIQRVEGDASKMQTYQYTYMDGHSDYTGDLVSLIGYDRDQKAFVVLDSWKENIED